MEVSDFGVSISKGRVQVDEISNDYFATQPRSNLARTNEEYNGLPCYSRLPMHLPAQWQTGNPISQQNSYTVQLQVSCLEFPRWVCNVRKEVKLTKLCQRAWSYFSFVNEKFCDFRVRDPEMLRLAVKHGEQDQRVAVWWMNGFHCHLLLSTL